MPQPIETQTPPVVETWFGDAFAQLHPLLQQLHRSGGTLSGTVDIRLGTGLAGWVGRRLAQKLGVPPREGSASMRVSIYSSEAGLHWDRSFNETSTFASTFTPAGRYPSGYWVESSGLLRLKLAVAIVDGGWVWQPIGGRLAGVPFPVWLLPRTVASKRIDNGRYQFKVEVGLPLLGTVLSYSGNMNPMINELDVVRVVTLLQNDRQFSGSEGVSRAPRVGDRATVVHVLQPGHVFIVEAVDSEGHTLWLADFLAEELQLEIKYRSRN